MFKSGVWFWVAMVALLTVVMPSVSASASNGCFANIADCFATAAQVNSFWYRTWEALDCELAFIGCIRLAIFGR